MNSNDNPAKLSTKQVLIAERNKKALQSYLFLYKVVENGHNFYYPYYPWFDPEGEIEDVPERNDDFFEIELYRSGNDAKHRFSYSEQLQKYFQKPFGENAHLGNRWVLMPKSTYEEFLQTINRFSLTKYKDLLLECICIAQKVLAREVDFWEQSENQYLKKNARKQAEVLKEIVDFYRASNAPLKKGQSKLPPQASSIIVNYGDKSFKIDHRFLIDEIITKGFEETLQSWSGDNWEDAAKTYSRSFDGYPHKNEFKFELAKSFYRFFTEMDLFKVTPNESTPNDLMLCIVSLIELSLIEIGTEGLSQEAKIKNIRNWIRR